MRLRAVCQSRLVAKTLKSRIKGSIEPTHGSVCSGVRKFQSMNVLKLLSTNKANCNIKCPFRILAYIYSNQDIIIIYWIFQPAISSKYCNMRKGLT